MNDNPDIINTPLIPASTDAFWQDEQGLLAGLTTKPALFITQPIATGSSEQKTLDNMLRACKIPPEEYQVLQLLPTAKLAWHLIRDHVKPKYVILVGVEVEQLGLSVQLMPHQVSRFNDCAFIPTMNLAGLDQYPEIKKHFWDYGLKPVFIDRVYG